MRVAFLNLLASPEQRATGVRTSILGAARRLAGRGHEVTVLTSGGGREGRSDGVTLVRLGPLASFSGANDLLDPRYLASRYRYMRRAARWLQQHEIDLVEVAEGGLEQLFLLFGRRPFALVTRLHGNVSHTLERTAISRGFEKLEAIVTRRSDAIYSPSQGYADSIARDYGLDRSKIEVIPYCLDLSPLTPDSGESGDRKAVGDRKIVLFSATLSERKGIAILQAVAERLVDRDDIVFVVAGAGGPGHEISRLENVIATGELRPAELGSWYRDAHVFLLPSHFENLSLSILEAIHFGLPVLALDVGGNRDLVQDDVNGLLVAPGATASIPSILEGWIDDEATRSRLSRGSLEISKRFESERVASEIEDFYRRVLDRRAGGRT